MKDTRSLVCIALVIIILVITACLPVIGTKAVDDAVMHDFGFSVEKRHDATAAMWVRNDDTAIYCLPTEALYQKALAVINSQTSEMIMHYKSLNAGENAQCNNLEASYVYKDSSNTYITYVVTDIQKASDLPK